MASLQITDKDIPSLDGKIVVLTGGSSGIGLAASKIFASHGAKVFNGDMNPPKEEENLSDSVVFVKTDVSSWESVLALFKAAGGEVDIVVANAGIIESPNCFTDKFDENGELMEPSWRVIDVNLKGVINTVKIGIHHLKKQGRGGSVVMTASCVGYVPTHTLPVYSATKHGVVGIMRTLRNVLPAYDIGISCIAPGATQTGMLDSLWYTSFAKQNISLQPNDPCGLAIAYSATAKQEKRSTEYGLDSAEKPGAGRWNGRTIFVQDGKFTEIEEAISRLRPQWMGEGNEEYTLKMQLSLDDRDSK